MKTLKYILFSSFLVLLFVRVEAQQKPYLWLKTAYEEAQSLEARIAPPAGFERVEAPLNSYADWLRKLPMKPGHPEVKLYNGELKGNQSAQYAVLDIDVGDKDLQQCADAVMRLKAEYHYSCDDFSSIHFNFTSGDRADYSRWISGYRPIISGNKVSWRQKAGRSQSYTNFRQYMNIIFNYAGTFSLSKELKNVDSQEIKSGDVFIYGGFPGHAVIVLDVVQEPVSGKKRFLLAQSYMPAQEIHILRNPNNPDLSPWYDLPEGELHTPEWTFPVNSLKRFQ